jgi:hypothetical protein
VAAGRARSAGGISWKGVTRLDERQVDHVDVPHLDDLLIWEHRNQRSDHFGYQRFISGRVKNVVLVVSGTAQDPGMAWEDLVSIAAAQAAKLRTQLN